MSSVRGQSARGRGRGDPQHTPTKPRGSSSRGRGFSNVPQRGGSTTATRGAFTQPPRASASRGTFGVSRGASNAFKQQPPSSRSGASGAPKSRGSWQDRWQALSAARERERADAIRRGLIADPEKPRALADAITPFGTCQEMCAEFERVQRVVQKDVWDEETDPNCAAFALTENEPDEARMVKKFRRAAAGLEEQLPSDLRPPAVLRKTCDYLFNDVIGNSESLARVHHFVWDRTRAIRNDFSIQQMSKPEDLRIAIECYERIARFHILSLHQLALPERPYSKYDWQQEREQLDRTLLSLMQYYDDCHGRIPLPNEAEFRSYCVIFQLQDPIPDLEDRVQTWPRQILQDSRVQKALDVYMAACNVLDAQGPLKPRASHLIARQDWQRFWSLVASKEVSYLMACVAEIYFNLVRRTALAALFRTSRANSTQSTPDWTVDVLRDLLAFDDVDQVYEYCEKFGFTFREREDDGQAFLDFSSVKGRTLPEPAAGIPQQSKTSLVEEKRFGRTIPSIISGLSVREARDSGMVVEEDEGMDDRMEETVDSIGSGGVEQPDEEDSLFVPDTLSKPDPTPLITGPTSVSTAQSPFSNMGGGFGKPSGFGETTNPFAPKPLQAVQQAPNAAGGIKFNFTQTAPVSTTPAPAATPTTSPAAPLFNFTAAVGPSTTTPEGSPVASSKKESASIFSASSQAQDTGSLFSRVTPPTVSAAPSLFQPSTTTSSSLFQPSTTSGSSLFQPSTTTSSSLFQPSTTSGPSLFQPSPTPTFAGFTGLGKSTTPQQTPSQPETTSQSVFSSSLQPVDIPSTFTFGPSPAAPALEAKGPPQQPHLRSPSQSPPTPTSTANHHPPLPPLNPHIRRPSSANDNRPKKPSPLSHSINATDESSAVDLVASEVSAPAVRPVTPVDDFETNVTRVAHEFFYEPIAGGLDQYVLFHVSRTIRQVKAQLDEEEDNALADAYRHRTIRRRYGRRWRNLFWQERLAKSGRERRQRRQRRLHERASAEFESVSAADLDLSSSRGGSVLRGIEPYRTDEDMGSFWSKMAVATTEPVSQAVSASPDRRPVSSHGVGRSNGAPHGIGRASATSGAGHKRFKSTSHVDDRGRVAKPATASQADADLLRRSAFLAFSGDKEGTSIKNTTASSYFRLKAMGMHRIDHSAQPRGLKRRMSTSAHTSAQTSPPSLRTTPHASPSQERTTARALMPPPSQSRASSRNNDEDEALLARLRAARLKLDQSTSFYKTETKRDEDFRTSVNMSQSSNEYDSPTMAEARATAQSRALYAGANDKDQDVPAYRLRKSKFIPREQYGRAIERSREMRASRSRDTSRPLSQASFHDVEAVDTNQQPAFDYTAGHAPVEASSSKNPWSVAETQTFGSAPPTNGLPDVMRAPEQQSEWSQPSATNLSNPTYLSFSQHNTELPDDNPFLQTATSKDNHSLQSATFQDNSFHQSSTFKGNPFLQMATNTDNSFFQTATHDDDSFRHTPPANDNPFLQTAASFGPGTGQTAMQTDQPTTSSNEGFEVTYDMEPETQTTNESLSNEEYHSFTSVKYHPSAPVVDQTIQPSQINEALANSFGEGHGNGRNHQLSLSSHGPSLTQDNSYLASQAITMLSDEEDEAEPESRYAHHHTNGINRGEEESDEELMDDDADEEKTSQTLRYGDPYATTSDTQTGHRHPYSYANPFAALADNNDGEEEHDAEEDQDEEQDWRPLSRRQAGTNGEVDYDDEEGAEGEVDYDDDEEGEDGDIDEDETDDGDVEDEETDYDEDREGEGEEHGYANGGDKGFTHANLMWAREDDADDTTGSPSGKATALQAVGHTVEAAIELDSD